MHKEFGIRSTPGADARELLRMVLKEGMKLQSAAVLVGLGAALLLAGFLRGSSSESSPSILRRSCW